SVSCVVLRALDVRLHVRGRQQPNRVPELGELACPVMRRGARFHADKTDRNLCKKRNYLCATKFSHNDDIAMRVDSMDLEDVLGQIDTDGADVHAAPTDESFHNDHPMALRCRVRASSTTSFATKHLSPLLNQVGHDPTIA